MKTKILLVKQVATLLLLASLNLEFSTIFAQGTALTYQGRLNSGPNPANGSYDLRLALYDALTGGSAVATNRLVIIHLFWGH